MYEAQQERLRQQHEEELQNDKEYINKINSEIKAEQQKLLKQKMEEKRK